MNWSFILSIVWIFVFHCFFLLIRCSCRTEFSDMQWCSFAGLKHLSLPQETLGWRNYPDRRWCQIMEESLWGSYLIAPYIYKGGPETLFQLLRDTLPRNVKSSVLEGGSDRLSTPGMSWDPLRRTWRCCWGEGSLDFYLDLLLLNSDHREATEDGWIVRSSRFTNLWLLSKRFEKTPFNNLVESFKDYINPPLLALNSRYLISLV